MVFLEIISRFIKSLEIAMVLLFLENFPEFSKKKKNTRILKIPPNSESPSLVVLYRSSKEYVKEFTPTC